MLHLMATCDEISSCTISLKFSAFSLPRKFLQMFLYAFQALLSVEFHAVRKFWSLDNCVICGPLTISSFILASIISGIFCLK
jgi:formate dehydrogenase maturation protein FdhE